MQPGWLQHYFKQHADQQCSQDGHGDTASDTTRERVSRGATS